ncbi:hypothetical protein L0657_25925 [Dyadobacter sp. CY345]|uniref:hypothetical protein n=1 Tax=Dyadobacter sp. CY345 TaxID=2909335 RepID=UPI001F2D04B5|nr:hypothetical protein [Dyadobacter sp. CY345]MCF2447419.1 hypothetical protein [Dyadobacter sp. CY345]
MKRITLLVCMLIFFSLVCIAVKPKKSCPELSTMEMGKYQFKEFKEGKVYFKNGKFTKVKLNYNYLHGAIEYISPNKDTLIMTNKERIDFIALDERMYYAQKEHGDIEVVAEFGKVKLAKKTHLVLRGNKTNASEQKYSANPESATPTSLLISNQAGEFGWQNTTTKPDYKFKTDYYLIDQNRVFHPAKKSSFMKVYGKQKDSLSYYFHKNNVDFSDPEQLKSLLRFCNDL